MSVSRSTVSTPSGGRESSGMVGEALGDEWPAEGWNQALAEMKAPAVIFDGSGKISFVSTALLKRVGLPADALVGQRLSDVIKGRKSQAAFDAESLSSDGPTSGARWSITSESGARVTWAMSFFPTVYNRLQSWVAVGAEISDLVDYEAQIERGIAIAAAAIDGLSSKACVISQDGTILNVNQAWKEVDSDSRPGASIGNGVNYFDICERAAANGEPDAHRMLRGLRDVANGLSSSFEFIYKFNSPLDVSWYKAIVKPVEYLDQRLILIIHERTGRGSASSTETRRSQRLETLGVLAAGVAHDFNHTLTAMLGSALQAQQFRKDREAVLKNLQLVVEAGRSCKGLIAEILKFISPIDDERSVINLSDALVSTIQILKAGTCKQVKLSLSTPDIPVLCEINTVQLIQVALNIGLNAIQALGEKNGKVSFEVDRAVCDKSMSGRLGLMDGTTYGRIKITDNGSGIKPEDLLRIFTPFFSTKQDEGGTGLGLSVALKTIRESGGAIDVDTKLGVGTCFSIYLPAVDRPTNNRVKGEGGNARGKDSRRLEGSHVLLVEDDDLISQIMTAMLENEGCSVAVAKSGDQALLYLSGDHTPLSAVITDLNMPGMTGLDVLEKMRELNLRIPIILVSGFVDAASKAAFERDGLTQCVGKDEMFDRLIPVLLDMGV